MALTITDGISHSFIHYTLGSVFFIYQIIIPVPLATVVTFILEVLLMIHPAYDVVRDVVKSIGTSAAEAQLQGLPVSFLHGDQTPSRHDLHIPFPVPEIRAVLLFVLPVLAQFLLLLIMSKAECMSHPA